MDSYLFDESDHVQSFVGLMRIRHVRFTVIAVPDGMCLIMEHLSQGLIAVSTRSFESYLAFFGICGLDDIVWTGILIPNEPIYDQIITRLRFINKTNNNLYITTEDQSINHPRRP
jgi:hypothetical protein